MNWNDGEIMKSESFGRMVLVQFILISFSLFKIRFLHSAINLINLLSKFGLGLRHSSPEEPSAITFIQSSAIKKSAFQMPSAWFNKFYSPILLFIQITVVQGVIHKPSAWFPKNVPLFWDREK